MWSVISKDGSCMIWIDIVSRQAILIIMLILTLILRNNQHSQAQPINQDSKGIRNRRKVTNNHNSMPKGLNKHTIITHGGSGSSSDLGISIMWPPSGNIMRIWPIIYPMRSFFRTWGVDTQINPISKKSFCKKWKNTLSMLIKSIKNTQKIWRTTIEKWSKWKNKWIKKGNKLLKRQL